MRAYHESRYREASKIYGEHIAENQELELTFLAARASVRDDPANALKLLLDLRFSPTERRLQVDRDDLLAEAFARTRDFAAADERLEAALSTARHLRDSDLIALVGYRMVRRYLIAEDAQEARKALKVARSGASETSRLHALWAEILILPYEERVREQADLLVEFLHMLNPHSYEQMNLRAWGTHNLAGLVREFPVEGAISEIERQLGGVAWGPDFAMNRYQTLRALGWAKAMQGDYFNAFRYLKQASGIAPTDSWRVVAACDRAYLARALGEHRWSRAELDEAEQCSQGVNWQTTQGEERMGLLLLAELFSGIDPTSAAMYLARYRQLDEPSISPLLRRHDARLTAFAQYSTGVVELALGERRRGLAQLRGAQEVFDRFGYEFRAARCLLTEYHATTNNELFGEIERRLRHYPQSWLAAEMHSIGQRDEVALPPMQRRVFAEICKGKSNAEIAKTLGRSTFTVSNHIKQIFKTFGVGSRSALVAEAIRRGLIETN